jgi:hypothetical protein
MFIRGLSVHQKCFSYALTNLLFGLWRSMWIINMLVTRTSPHPKAPAHPSTPKVLRTRERAPIPCFFCYFSPLDSQLNLSRSLGVHQYETRFPFVHIANIHTKVLSSMKSIMHGRLCVVQNYGKQCTWSCQFEFCCLCASSCLTTKSIIVAKFKSTKCAKLYRKLWSTPRSLKIAKSNMKRM